MGRVADQRKVTTSLVTTIYDDLKSLADERGLSVAAMLRQLTVMGVAEEKTPVMPLGIEAGFGPPHLYFFGTTGQGKSTVIDEYVIPRLGRGRRTVVLTDSSDDIRKIYRDAFKVVPLASSRKFPSFDNERYEEIKALQAEPEFEAEVSGAINAVMASRHRKIIVAVNAPDKRAKKWLVNSFITEVVGRDWGNPGLLFVVEDAHKYDCEELVGSGRKNGIVAILAGVKEPDEDTSRNTRLVLGPVGTATASRIDPTIAAMAKRLGCGEFLWQYSAGRWARFKHKKRGVSKQRTGREPTPQNSGNPR